jgi:hypothetical protein
MLLTIWPFLNLLLIIGIWGAMIRYASRISKNRLYVFSTFVVLIVGVLFVTPSVTTIYGGEYTSVFLQSQTAVPVTNQAYHDGVLLTSPVFTIKSHVAVWPVKLPDVSQPVEPESGLLPDALQTTLLIKATDMMPGLQWIPQTTSVRVLANRKLVYRASGYIRWRLLGVPVYNQPKEYVGQVSI